MIANLTKLVILVFITLGIAATGLVQAATPSKEELITQYLEFREKLARDGRIDIGEMSKSIGQAVNDGERLEREGNYQVALDKLLGLQRFAPLPDIPSFNVQMLASWLYGKLGNAESASAYRARADAMRELISQRIGKGDSSSEPIRGLMANDVSEWARMQLARIAGVKAVAIQGRELLEITYVGPAVGSQPRVAYFEIDQRVQQKMRIFEPIPIAQMRPADVEQFENAKRKRERFLADSFAYVELLVKVDGAIKKATALDQQGNAVQALAALAEIEQMRPIEEIPLSMLIAAYSYLNGKIGNSQKQVELRRLIFGINQSIAHSGDGLSPETAIHVIATSEEYEWLRDKKLTFVRQSLLDHPIGKFDVLKTKDAGGVERDYYFNITGLFPKYTQGLASPLSKP